MTSSLTKLPPELEVALAALVLAAAVFDVRLSRIPNWLCATGLVLGLVLNFRLMQFAGLRQAALGVALALAVYFPLFALRAMGGGDVKLMAAIGALAGPSNWFIIFVLTALFGGVFAISLLAIRGGLVQAVRNVATILIELVHLRAPHRTDAMLDIAHPSAVTLPHAISICAGTLVFLWLSIHKAF